MWKFIQRIFTNQTPVLFPSLDRKLRAWDALNSNNSNNTVFSYGSHHILNIRSRKDLVLRHQVLPLKSFQCDYARDFYWPTICAHHIFKPINYTFVWTDRRNASLCMLLVYIAMHINIHWYYYDIAHDLSHFCITFSVHVIEDDTMQTHAWSVQKGVMDVKKWKQCYLIRRGRVVFCEKLIV